MIYSKWITFPPRNIRLDTYKIIRGEKSKQIKDPNERTEMIYTGLKKFFFLKKKKNKKGNQVRPVNSEERIFFLLRRDSNPPNRLTAPNADV